MLKVLCPFFLNPGPAAHLHSQPLVPREFREPSWQVISSRSYFAGKVSGLFAVRREDNEKGGGELVDA